MAIDERADLLGWLTLYEESAGIEVGRADPWRSRRWTGAAIVREANRVAAELAAFGIRPGDRIALYVGDGPLWVAAFLGTLRAGAVAVPLDLTFDPGFLRETVVDLEVSGWCTERELPDLGLELPRVELSWAPVQESGPGDTTQPPWPEDDPDRLAQIVLTSGTRGAPKAVPVSHRNLRSVLDALAAGIDEYRWAIRLAPRITIGVSLPLSHLYGQVLGVFVPPLLSARATMISPMPGSDLARVIRSEKVWVLATVPRTLEMMGAFLRNRGETLWGRAETDRQLESVSHLSWIRRWAHFLRLRRPLGTRLVAVVSGGAALDRGVEDLWRTLGFIVVQGYGLTETAPLVTLNHPFDSKPGSLGRPLPGVEVRIGAGGEILVRGANVARNLRGDRPVDSKGWLHTGDLGHMDASGRLYFGGRVGERIVTPAGVNIDPGPIASRLREKETVLDAIVMERPWGERGVLCAVVVGKPGTDPTDDVRATNLDLQDAARIRDWRTWPEPDFPRTRTGKARRPEIEAWLESQAPTEARVTEAREEHPGADRARAPLETIVRHVADLAGIDPSTIEPSTRLDDVLGSLDRIELATRLEMIHGIGAAPQVFSGETRLIEVAGSLTESPAERTIPRPRALSTRPAPRAERAVRESPRRFPGPTPGEAFPDDSTGRSPPEARGRSWPPTRLARTILRELVLRPAWHAIFDQRVEGLAHLHRVTPPFLLACNHLSIFDPGPVLFALPRHLRSRFATTAMWEHFARRRTGRIEYLAGILGLDLIPLVQTGDWRPTLRIAGRVVDRGGCPLIFPEGARSSSGELGEFRPGVAVMARELHLPIVPCAAAGLLAVLPIGARWPRNCWFQRARVAIHFGEALPPPQPEDDPVFIVERLRSRIEDLLTGSREVAGRF